MLNAALSNEGLQSIVANRSLIAASPHLVMFADAVDFLLEQMSQTGYSELNWTWALSNLSGSVLVLWFCTI